MYFDNQFYGLYIIHLTELIFLHLFFISNINFRLVKRLQCNWSLQNWFFNNTIALPPVFFQCPLFASCRCHFCDEESNNYCVCKYERYCPLNCVLVIYINGISMEFINLESKRTGVAWLLSLTQLLDQFQNQLFQKMSPSVKWSLSVVL